MAAQEKSEWDLLADKIRQDDATINTPVNNIPRKRLQSLGLSSLA
jgi:hypothetical protein